MINKVTLIGRLGRDPEIKSNCANLNVGTTSHWLDKQSNQWRSETEWHRCVVFGQRIDYCKKLVKGSLVYIEGKIKSNEYEKNGEKRYSTSIIVEQIKSMSKLNFKNEDETPANTPNNDKPFADLNDYKIFDDSDNIPF